MTDFARLGILIDTAGLRRTEPDLDRFDRQFGDVDRTVTRSTDSMSSSITGFGKAAVTALAAAAAGLLSFQTAAAGINDALAFNAALAETSTLLSGGAGEMAGLSDAARQLAADFGTGATQQVQAFYQAISAGATSVADATVLLDQANKLAEGGVTDVTTSVSILTAAMDVYKTDMLTAAQVSDALFVGMKGGKTTIGELGASLGKVLPLAQALGLSFDETVAATAALTRGGLSTAEAVTGLGAALTAVLAPTDTAKLLAKDLSIEFNSAGLQGKTFAEFMAEVVEATDGNADSLQQLFSGLEATKTALALSGQAGQIFGNILEEMANKLGATDAAVEKINASLSDRWDDALAKGQAALLTFGLAAIEVVVPAMEALATAVTLLVENADFLAISLGVLAATKIPAMVAGLFALAASLGTVSGLMAVTIAATAAFSFALMAIPFVAVAVGLTAIYRLYQSNSEAAATLAVNLEDLAGAQNSVESAMTNFYANVSEQSLSAWEMAEKANVALLRNSLLSAKQVLDNQVRLRSVTFSLNPFASAFDTEEITNSKNVIAELDSALATAEARLSAVGHAQTTFNSITSETVVVVSDAVDSLKSLADATSLMDATTAHDMADGFAFLADEIQLAASAQRELSEIDASRAITGVLNEVSKLKNELGLSAGQVSNLGTHLRFIESQDTFGQQATALASVVQYLDAATGGASNMNAAARAVYESFLAALNTAIGISQVNMVAPINSAVTSANQLAHQFGIAYGFASALATMEVSSGQSLSFPGVGPVDGADQGGGLSFSDRSFTLPQVTLAPFVAPNIPSVGGGIGGGSGGGGALGAQNDLMEEGKRLTESLRTEQEKYNDAILQADRLLDAGAITLDTYNAHVAQLEQELSDTSFESLIQGIGSITDSLVDAAFAGQGLGDAFSKVLLRMAADALKSNIKSIITDMLSPGQAGGGGGFLGAVVGALFGGGRANGGPVSPDNVYQVGEQGTELFVPSSQGHIVPNSKMGGEMGGNSGGAVDVRVHVDEDGNWQAAVARISGNVVARESPMIVRQSVAVVREMNIATKKR